MPVDARREANFSRFRDGNAVLDIMFGKGRMAKDQTEALLEDFGEVEKIADMPDVWDLVAVGLERYKNYKKSPRKLIPQMKFGSKLLMTNRGVTGIWVVAKAVFSMLHKRSPVDSGFYRSSHEIWVNGRPTSVFTTPRDLPENTVIQILNRAEYASTLETPDYGHKVYRNTFKLMNRRYSREWDMRLEFGAPLSYGGNRTKRNLREPRFYQIPVITIGPLNSLPRAGQFVVFRRRKLSQRTNVLARRRQRQPRA